MRAILNCLALAAACHVVATASAQTSTPGPGIDVEIYNPGTGGNSFCAAPGDTLWAYLYVAPATGGSSSFVCSVPCGAVHGGPANIAATSLDITFNPARLRFHSAHNNGFMGSAGADGMLRLETLGAGRVGWALAGDWTPDGDPSGALADPCHTALINEPGWIVRFAFTVISPGSSQIVVRDEPDFRAAFADICGSETFTSSNGGVDEILPATVATGLPACPQLENVIFRNGFETGDTSAWP